jgi:hypothetical protein
MWSCRRFLGGAAAVAVVASVPAVAEAATYGGFSAQNWPISVEVSRDRREVKRVGMGFELNCTSGIRVDLDRYSDIVLHRNGRFSATYSNSRNNLPNGNYYIYGGNVSGRLNRSHTGISGTMNLHYTAYDAANAVIDNCDSGEVKWKAR